MKPTDEQIFRQMDKQELYIMCSFYVSYYGKNVYKRVEKHK
jgi:hypothetical protein